MKTIVCEDNNINELRLAYPNGLHFVVGDTHCQYPTLKALMDKIKLDAQKDYVYFLGDYNGGGNPTALLRYLSAYYQTDNARPGFHMIRGNHERELSPYYPLQNLPDIIVLRMKNMTYYLAHAGMIASVFDLINEDISARPDETVFAYRLDDASVAYDAPLRQMIWSRRGLYSQKSHWHQWPSQGSLYHNRAVILHGHTPYCFFKKGLSYGDDTVFWENQHIFFSEDLQSFDVDANIKGRYECGEGWRGLTCVCLEVFDNVAGENNCSLSCTDIEKAPNGVFSVPYTAAYDGDAEGNLDMLLSASPDMKTITHNGSKAVFVT